MVYKALKHGEIGMCDVLNLVKQYLEGKGPELLERRPLLCIWPGKLHGEPHLVGTRIPSAAIFALQKSGYTLDQIQDMYPDAVPAALSQAIEFEQSLSKTAA